MLRQFDKTCKAVIADYVEMGLWKNPYFDGRPFPHSFFVFETELTTINGQTKRHILNSKRFKVFSRPGERSTIYKYLMSMTGGKFEPVTEDGLVNPKKLIRSNVILTLKEGDYVEILNIVKADADILKVEEYKSQNYGL